MNQQLPIIDEDGSVIVEPRPEDEQKPKAVSVGRWPTAIDLGLGAGALAIGAIILSFFIEEDLTDVPDETTID